jgi:hypothetical protein
LVQAHSIVLCNLVLLAWLLQASEPVELTGFAAISQMDTESEHIT